MSSANCFFSHQALCKEIATRIAGNHVWHLTSGEYGGKGRSVTSQYLQWKWKASTATEHFQKYSPMAKPPQPSDFYRPKCHTCLWNCVRCGDVNVELCHEKKERERKGEEQDRSPSKFCLYWDTLIKNVCARLRKIKEGLITSKHMNWYLLPQMKMRKGGLMLFTVFSGLGGLDSSLLFITFELLLLLM